MWLGGPRASFTTLGLTDQQGTSSKARSLAGPGHIAVSSAYAAWLQIR